MPAFSTIPRKLQRAEQGEQTNAADDYLEGGEGRHPYGRATHDLLGDKVR